MKNLLENWVDFYSIYKKNCLKALWFIKFFKGAELFVELLNFRDLKCKKNFVEKLLFHKVINLRGNFFLKFGSCEKI